MAMRLANITFDCEHPLKVASFWSAVLGRPVDGGSSDGFASIGVTDGDQVEPAWYFSKVPESKRAKNRVHVDITATDPEDVAELERLGATVVAEHEIPGHSWVVLHDPEGNEFCVARKNWTGFR